MPILSEAASLHRQAMVQIKWPHGPWKNVDQLQVVIGGFTSASDSADFANQSFHWPFRPNRQNYGKICPGVTSIPFKTQQPGNKRTNLRFSKWKNSSEDKHVCEIGKYDGEAFSQLNIVFSETIVPVFKRWLFLGNEPVFGHFPLSPYMA